MAKAHTKEARVAPRPGLVLPPKTARLKLPRPVDKNAVGGENWPLDPDQKAKSDARLAELKKQQFEKDADWKNPRHTGNGLEEFQDKIDWSRRQRGIFKKWFGKKSEDDG